MNIAPYLEAILYVLGAVVFSAAGVALTAGDSIPEQLSALRTAAARKLTRSSISAGVIPVPVVAIQAPLEPLYVIVQPQRLGIDEYGQKLLLPHKATLNIPLIEKTIGRPLSKEFKDSLDAINRHASRNS